MIRGPKKLPPDTTWPPAGVRDIPDVSPDTLTAQCVLDMRRRTRNRIVEYLCRAYLQFGYASMLAKDLQQLCSAINAARRL
jgi:hypothetical protein